MECLFEAQTMKYFGSYFESLPSPKSLDLSCPLPLDAYACGYCIANILTGMSFSVKYKRLIFSNYDFKYFTCGLKTNIPSAGYIVELDADGSDISLYSALEFGSLQRLTSLHIFNCNAYKTHHLIPCMTCLNKLDISNSSAIVQEDGLVMVFESLLHSSVTTLNIMETEFCCYQSKLLLAIAALEKLIDPTCGRLEELLVGDLEWDENCRVIGLLSAHSSLKSLTLYGVPTPLLSQFMSNTCLVELRVNTLEFECSNLVRVVSNLVAWNKTLKYLTIENMMDPENLGCLNDIVKSLHHNKTLLKLTVCFWWDFPKDDDEAIFMR